jgi:CheY-like chemotaxis protein
MGNQKFKVLLIDDIEEVRQVLQLCVETEIDAEIIEANSGNEAIEKLEHLSNFNLIICDFNMPNGNGADVYNYIRNNNIKVPFVLCTTENISDVLPFSERPPYFYIQKPSVSDGIEELFLKLKNEKSDNDEKGEVCYLTSPYVKISIKTLLSFKIISFCIFTNIKMIIICFH